MERSIYEQLGGEEGVRALTRSFYRFMAELPETQVIRAMHPADLSISEQKLFEFLSGWTGGPQLFVERHGPPMLRRRHFPFSIGASERDQWLLCMKLAIEERGIAEPLKSDLFGALARLADHMRNRAE